MTDPDASLPAHLSARARHASDGRLALDAGGGLFAAIAALVWRPRGWLLLLGAALCFAAFGAWGIADRELAESGAAGGPTIRIVRILRALFAAVGAAAAVMLLLVFLGVALGSLIS